jgi:hypothetical protein
MVAWPHAGVEPEGPSSTGTELRRSTDGRRVYDGIEQVDRRMSGDSIIV